MKTVNISLPESLYRQTEGLISGGEYASRSEVVRTALRLYLTLQSQRLGPEFSTYKKLPTSQIKAELLASGHRSEFVKDVTEGLRKSSVHRKSK